MQNRYETWLHDGGHLQGEGANLCRKMWREGNMLHGDEHVLIRPIIPNAQHKVWCIALVSQLLQDAVHSIAL